MMKAYTELDLLRFIYKEVEVCEYFEMDFAIKDDKNLREEYHAIERGVNSLPEISHDPAAMSVQNILAYADA